MERWLRLLVAVTPLFLSNTVNSAAAETSSRIKVAFENATVEEAVTVTAKAIGPSATVVCDSRGGSVRRSQAAIEVIEARVGAFLAELFERQAVRNDRMVVLRSPNWFSATTGKRPQSRTSLRWSAGKWDGQLYWAPLGVIAERLSKLGRSAHWVSLPLRSRMISGMISQVSSEQFRKLVELVYPDTEWILRGKRWELAERQGAEIIRAVAKDVSRFTDAEMSPKAALHVQAAAELTPQQIRQLAATGKTEIRFPSLSPPTQGLMSTAAANVLSMVERSGVSPDRFVDFTRKAEWGVQFHRRPDGTIGGRVFGPSRTGLLAFF